MIENGETGVDGTEWEGMDEIEMAWAYWNQWADNFSETDVEKMRKGKAE